MPRRLPLMARRYGALRGPLITVALIITAVSGLVAAAPAVFGRLAATEIADTVATAPTTARYLVARPAGSFIERPSRDPTTSGLGDADRLYGGWHDQLEAVRAGLPQPLRSHVGRPDWTVTYEPIELGPNAAGQPPSAHTSLVTVLDPHPERVARLEQGSWPAGGPGDETIDIAVSARAATSLGGTVGTRFGDYRIAGIFRPIDPAADYWLLNTGLVEAQVDNDGNAPVHTTITGFVGPQQAGVELRGPGTYRSLTGANLVWYPLQLDVLTSAEARRIVSQLGGVVAAPRSAPPEVPDGYAPDRARTVIRVVTLTADVIRPLTDALGRIDAGAAVLQVALAGPLLAVLVVLIAALAALIRRGRATTALLMARGARLVSVRRHWAGAGLVAGVPSATFALVAVRIGFGPATPASGLIAGALIGLLPAVLLGLAPRRILGADTESARSAMTAARSHAAVPHPSRHYRRWRAVAEGAVILAAAASTYLLLFGGLRTDAGAAVAHGPDLFVVLAPALLIAAACVLVLRGYPLPLRILAALARRRSGAVGFVGSLRALRDPVSGLVPAVAIVAGVAVAGLSGALISTIDNGTRQVALSELGAPIRVTELSGDAITDTEYAQIKRLPGVGAAARFGRVALAPVTVPGQAARPTSDVVLVDLAALPQVQQNVTAALPALNRSADDSGAFGIGSTTLAPAGSTVTVGNQNVLLVATAASVPGVTRSKTFVLLDSTTTSFGTFRPTTMLVAPAEDADAMALAQDFKAILGQHISVESATDAVSHLRDGALATGMRWTLYGALIAAAVAALAALQISIMTGTTARARLMAIARVLGLNRGQRRALLLWEQVPVVSAALVGGAGLGIGLTLLIHSTVDLAPFTGGDVTPPLAVDWPGLAALFAGFLAVVAMSVLVGVLLTRRTTAATAIKLDED